jgi:hypothetical protein
MEKIINCLLLLKVVEDTPHMKQSLCYSKDRVPVIANQSEDDRLFGAPDPSSLQCARIGNWFPYIIT